MKIFISKRSIIWFICITTGILFLIRGLVEYEKYRDGIEFAQLDTSDYKCGTYIRDDITDFMKGQVVGQGYTGQYGELDFYDVYLVPVKNGDYVRVMIKYQETKELLEKAVKYDAEPIPFSGTIIAEKDLRVSSYSQNGGFDTSRVVFELLVKQKTSGSINNTLFFGLDLIMIGLMMSLTGLSGDSYIVDEQEERAKKKRKPVKSYNVENDILCERKKLAMLEQQKVRLQKNYKTSLTFMIVSFVVLLIMPEDAKVLGILPFAFAAKGCLEYWLHQPNTTSAILAGIFGVTPLHRKITECEEMLEKLERLERSNGREEPIIMLASPEEEDELALIEKGYTVRQEEDEE